MLFNFEVRSNRLSGEIMMKTSTFFIVFLCTITLMQATSHPQPLGFDNLIRIKQISDPQLSPKGDLIAFVVTVIDKEENISNSDIWIVSSDGGEMRRLTSSPQADYNPRWSPDGKKIAFISTRGGSPQIWLIDPFRGEASPLTRISSGVNGFVQSPTGKYLAFSSSIYPDCPDDDCIKRKNEAIEKSKVKAKIFHGLLFRHINSWRDGKRSHVFLIPSEGGKATDLTPGDFDTPPFSLGSSNDYSLSPDGNEICFVRNIDPELKLSLGTNNDLFITPVEGGEIKQITSNKANDNFPRYSPDGKFIAYRAMAVPGHEADKYRLILYDRKTQKTTNLTEDLDRSVDEILWSPDSSFIYFSCEEKGQIGIFRVSIRNMDVEKILDGHYISSPYLSPDGEKMILLKQAINRPPDIYSFDLETKKIVQLTDINHELLASLQMNPAEVFWFEGAEKEKIHGFMVKPPFFDSSKKYPLIILLHGGPQDQWSDSFTFRWNVQMFASQGYIVAMINFHGSSGFGQHFTDSISGDWGGKPYKEVIYGLDYLVSHYNFIDKNHSAAAGGSYGGYLINWIESQTDRFNCLISHAGLFDLRSFYGSTDELWSPEWEFKGTPWTNKEMYEKFSPSSYVRNFKTPCLITHGENDFRVPVSQAFQFFTSLQRMKVPSKMLYFPDEDHYVQKPQNLELWYKTILEWLARYLKEEKQSDNFLGSEEVPANVLFSLN